MKKKGKIAEKKKKKKEKLAKKKKKKKWQRYMRNYLVFLDSLKC